MIKLKLHKLFFNHIDYLWLLILILISTFLKLCEIGNNLNNKITLTNTLDFSWQTDIIERLLHGFIAGRDFIFTYGPLYQLLASIPSLIFKIPSYTSTLYAQIIFTIISCLLIFFTTKLITTNKKETIILSTLLLFLIDLISYPHPSDLIRILLPILYALLYTKFASANHKLSPKVIIILLLPTLFGLFTFDLFILCVLITIIITLYKTHLLAGIIQLSVIAVSAIITSFLLNQNFNYLLYSFDTVKNYQFIMNIPFSINKNLILFIFPIALTTIYFYARKTLHNQTELIKYLTILTITSLLELKSAFIRSDEGHIIMGIYPSIIILTIALYYLFKNKTANLLLFSLTIILFILIPYKTNYYTNISINNLKTSLSLTNQKKSFFDIYKFPDNYHFKSNDFQYFHLLTSKNPEKIMIYPYDNYLLNINNQTHNTLPLQFYAYSNSLVEEKAIEKLKLSPPQFIILEIDKHSALPLDNIPNFSRNPLIAKWILTNYSVHKNMKKYLILKFNPNKKSTSNETNCQIYEIQNKNIQYSLFEKFFKPSTYYLGNNYEIRLPYNSNQKEILIIKGYSDPKKLEEIFSQKIDFQNFKLIKNHNLLIAQKYPFSKKKKTIENITTKCY